MLAAYAAYALLVLSALAIYAWPSLEIRTLATVLVLGPCTMLRPYVIVVGAVLGWVSAPRVETAVVAASAALVMLVLPALLARRWRRTQGIAWE
jgi:hypothetical protein